VTFVENVSEKTGLDPSTVWRDLQIASGIPKEVRDILRNTDVANSKRDLLRIVKLPQEEQRAVAEMIAQGEPLVSSAIRKVKAELAAQDPATQPPGVEIILGDFAEVGDQIPDESVSLVFTDPPYASSAVHLYGPLAELSARVLKPGGSLICYVGHHNLPEVFDLITPHLKYWWAVALLNTISAINPGRHVEIKWKPLLWFVKGSSPAIEHCIADTVRPSGLDKTYHEWQQSPAEAEYFIDKLTQPGEVVFDPMAGTGTTLVAAYGLGRRAIGIEIEGAKIDIIRRRLQNAKDNSPEVSHR
jgi:SAM-dependent methyltransferase